MTIKKAATDIIIISIQGGRLLVGAYNILWQTITRHITLQNPSRRIAAGFETYLLLACEYNRAQHKKIREKFFHKRGINLGHKIRLYSLWTHLKGPGKATWVNYHPR